MNLVIILMVIILIVRNPCSSTNLIDAVSDGSNEMLFNPNSRPDSRNSLIDDSEETVESKIAATDIRSIVRPKQYVLHGSKGCICQ